MSEDSESPPGGQFLVYQAADGKLKIDVRLEGETVWLTQQHMAELFQTTKQNVGQHLKKIFAEGELGEISVVKNFFTTAADGKRYATNFYNLDAIISVGYRVKSAVATRFRIWATQRLQEFIVKGFTMDDERLKNPDQPFDYFDELMRRIQDIRTSERRFYQKITDIYATSIDYDPTQEVSLEEATEAVQSRLLEEIERSREPFMNHFRRTYGTDHPAPPVWCAIEVISFGSLVTLYRNTTRKVKKAVSDVFGVPSEVLESWILALNTVRNLCAHHARLLNKELGVKPRIPLQDHYPQWHEPVAIGPERVFGILSICKHCLDRIAPQSHWPERMRNLLADYPEIPIAEMGFPKNWEESPIWLRKAVGDE